MSDGELITPESSVVSSDAKQLPTEMVSSASEVTAGLLSTLLWLPGLRSKLTAQDTARTGEHKPRPPGHLPKHIPPDWLLRNVGGSGALHVCMHGGPGPWGQGFTQEVVCAMWLEVKMALMDAEFDGFVLQLCVPCKTGKHV